MASLLLLPLLLLCSAHTATASPQHQQYGVPPEGMSDIQAIKCKVPPCNTTTAAVTLALPVMLSLKDPRQESSSTWGLKLIHFQDNPRAVLGVVNLSWNNELSEVVLKSTSYGGRRVTKSLLVALQPGDCWLHLQVEMEGRQVTLSLLNATRKVTIMTVMFQVSPAPMVMVLPLTKLGYSAINSAIDNNTYERQLLFLLTAVLVAVSVVYSVALLVLVVVVTCCVGPGKGHTVKVK